MLHAQYDAQRNARLRYEGLSERAAQEYRRALRHKRGTRGLRIPSLSKALFALWSWFKVQRKADTQVSVYSE